MTVCSDKAWNDLWDSFNRLTTDTIRVDRAALHEVVACGETMPDNLIAVAPREGSKTVEVRRHELFLFLNHHGALRCDAKQS